MIELIKRSIEQYVERNGDYVFTLDRFRIPKFFYNSKENKRVNIQWSRSNFLKSQSSYSIKFKKDIDKIQDLKYIQEFPIIITFTDIWNNMLKCFGSNKDSSFFSLDYYFPEIGLNVEIDSPYHDNRRGYDMARDEYLRFVCGINTIRFYEYGKDNNKRKEYINCLRQKYEEAKNHMTSWNLLSPKEPNYSELLEYNFIEDNKTELLILEKFINRYSLIEFVNNNNIILTNYDLLNLNIKIPKDKIELFCLLVNRLFSNKLMVIDTNINSISGKDIFDISKMRYELDWNEIISKMKYIPGWIPMISVGCPVPNKYSKFIRIQTNEDRNIINLVNKLEWRGIIK